MNMNAVTMLGTVPEWTISDRLRKAREVSGLDQSEFADAIGISRGSISNYERGFTACKRPVLLAWAMCSGVSMDWLLTGQPENPQPAMPSGGLEECAVRESNPQPADIGSLRKPPAKVIQLRPDRLAKVIPLNIAFSRYVPAAALLEVAA